MLYDKRWDSKKNAKKDDAEVFSLHGLIAWLETQNPEETYNWNCYGACLLGRYLAEAGEPQYKDGARHIAVFGSGFKALDKYHFIARGIEFFSTAKNKPSLWTFGAALSRARKIAESA